MQTLRCATYLATAFIATTALAQTETRNQKDARLFLSVLDTCTGTGMNVEKAKAAWTAKANFGGKPLEGRRIDDSDNAGRLYDIAVRNPRMRDDVQKSGMTRERYIAENAKPPHAFYAAVFRLEESMPMTFTATQPDKSGTFDTCGLGASFEDVPAGLAAIEAALKLERRTSTETGQRPSRMPTHPTLVDHKVRWAPRQGVAFAALTEQFTTNPYGKIVLTVTAGKVK